MNDKKIKKVVSKLTGLELKVCDSLIKCQFASGINSDGSDVQTDLKESLKMSNISPASFAGVLGSLAKKGLYQNVLCHSFGLPCKTVIINGRAEKIRSDIGSVICLGEDPYFYQL